MNVNLDTKIYSKRDIINAVKRAYAKHVKEHSEQTEDPNTPEARAVRTVVREIGISKYDCYSELLEN